MEDIDNLCPECGSKIYLEFICPGYKSNGKWYTCHPSCGNGIEYNCSDCSWSYIDGLRSGHYDFERNETKRPEWING